MNKIGVEIEFYNVSYKKVIEHFKELGITVEDFATETRNVIRKETSNNWKLVYDRSVTGDNTEVWIPIFKRERTEGEGRGQTYVETTGEEEQVGLELVSPPLPLNDYSQVKFMMDELIKLGAKVDSTCGLHFHLDSRGFTDDRLKEIFMRYKENESSFDLLAGDERKNNTYCATLQDLDIYNADIFGWLLDDVFKVHVTGEYAKYIESIISKKKGPKYLKLNMSNHRTRGTIEIRHPKGSLDFEYLQTWVDMVIKTIPQFIQYEGEKNVTINI